MAGKGLRTMKAVVVAVALGMCGPMLAQNASTPAAPPTPPAPPSATIQNAGQPQFTATPVIVLRGGKGQTGGQTGSQTSGQASSATGGKPAGVPGVSVIVVPTVAQASQANPSEGKANSEIVVPAGTKILLALKSAVNTRSARVGDGVYLESTFPVVVGNRVVIPAGAYVQGQIDAVKAAGRMYHRAEVRMHFTTMILQNGSVVTIPGSLHDIPGQSDSRMKDDEGTVQSDGKKGKDAGTIAKTTAEGAGIGGIAGAAAGEAGRGLLLGGVAGAAVGLVYSMFTRSNEVVIPQGTPLEMTLQRPLVLETSQVASQPGAAGASSYVAAPNQPQPMKKPGATRQILCPDGSLGCQ
ncbi:MAG TPA: hypothetical protein VHX63_00330 [Acidobacteriaceae bacterium]|jgi:type IV secretion system protein VirB10|nr:hypothetical protein [Acidobacteriaceae bacterium]